MIYYIMLFYRIILKDKKHSKNVFVLFPIKKDYYIILFYRLGFIIVLILV